MNDKITLIVKVTDGCNLRCRYCYNSETQYTNTVLGIDKFEKLLKIVAPYRKQITVIWHGGEPTVCGVDYYEKAMLTETMIAKLYGVSFTNLLQTNGTLIDKKWVELFKKYDIKPGVSFDGIENDKYRQQGEKTLRGIKLLHKHGISCGAMAVVADDDYDVLANYKFFAEKKINVEFSPVFGEGGATELERGRADKFANDMVKLFDYWLYDKDGVNVRLFGTYISMALGTKFRVCANSSCHGKYLGITSDGTLYNCGRYSVTKYPFGNVDDFETLNEVFACEGFKALVSGAIARRNKCRAECEYFNLCGGGCSDCAVVENGLENIPQRSCATFRILYTHIKNTVDKIIAEKTPLSEFNPQFRNAFIKATAVSDDVCGADTDEKYGV